MMFRPPPPLGGVNPQLKLGALTPQGNDLTGDQNGLHGIEE
jgi:hypothetical protein